MKPSEIWQFVKIHTMEFEQEMRSKAKRTVKSPSSAYRKTAAINIQDAPGFDQHKVIQRQAEALGDYIIQVRKSQIKKFFFFYKFYVGHG